MSIRVLRAARRGPGGYLPTTALVAGLCVCLVAIAGGIAPYLFKPHLLGSEIAAQIRTMTGLSLTTRGDVQFSLLPRPHVIASGLRISDPSEALSIEGVEFRGDVRLLPLLVGRAELSSATLIRPKLVFDLDGLPMRTDNVIGRAIEDADVPDERRLGTLTIVDGAASLRSRRWRHAPSFSAINVTIDWTSLRSAATATGSMSINGTSTDVAAWVGSPSALFRGDSSSMTLRLHAAPVDLNAAGDLSRAANTTFRGHVTASTPSVQELMAFSGIRFPAPAHLANVSLNSDATLSIDAAAHTAVDLSGMRFHLDGNDFEGTLAFQSGEKPMFSGTLACDQLSLAPFLQALPGFMEGPDWSRTKIDVAEGRPVDLDLRISASHVRAGAFSIEDAAFSIMTRDLRTEVGLIEGKAYGGIVRGRLSIGTGKDGLDLRGTGSLADVDAGTLTWDTTGRQLATGSLSGSGTFETHGDSPLMLLRHLAGEVQATARDGELSTLDFGRLLSPAGPPQEVAGGRTPFTTLTFSSHVTSGVATIDNATLGAPGAQATIAGRLDIGRRQVDLEARRAAQGGPAIALKGPFENVVASALATDDGVAKRPLN